MLWDGGVASPLVQAMFGIGVPAMVVLAPLHSTSTHDDDLLSWISSRLSLTLAPR